MATMNRRHFIAGLSATAMALSLPGCANPANRSAPMPTPTGSGFPVQVEHRYGMTTVPAPPQRIVALGQTDLDPVVALGARPIAVGSFADSPYSPLRPWNSDHFPAEPTELNMQEIEFEKLAALQPDLILAVMSGITKGDYGKLSAIAPTVAQPKDYGDWAVPYRPHTEIIGAALGHPAEAAAMIDDLDRTFAEVRADHPSFTGKRAACAELWGADFNVIGQAAPRTQFLTDIGLALSPALVELVGKEYNAPLSSEKLNLLDDLDVVLWTTEHTAVDKLLEHKLVAPLRTTLEQRYVVAPDGGNDDLLYSIDWGTILSNRFAIEHAVPHFVRALDSDAATDPNS